VSTTAAIGFLSDYGLGDEFVGVCHGVIARRCPEARVIDITHAIPRQDVRTGAITLAAALPYLPAGVALAVVDPGVGGPRRALALRTAEQARLLVGPDNGLLMPAAARFGGVQEAFDVGGSRVRLQPMSSSFHGRDLFAPVAAALAAGEELSSLGDAVPAGELAQLELPAARLHDGALSAHVLRIDGFGNVSLDAGASELAQLGVERGASVTVQAPGSERRALFAASFADVPAGELVLLEDSARTLALAVNLGSAAELLGLSSFGDELVLRRA
jgi:hypothetical protein